MRVPAPDKPVGVGAYWMVTDRSSILGVEVIRYRVFRVQEVDKAKVKLSLEIRQYAAKPSVQAAGEKLEVSRFESQGKGEVALILGNLLAPESAYKERMLAVEMAGGQGGPGPMGGPMKGLQAETTAEVIEPQK